MTSRPLSITARPVPMMERTARQPKNLLFKAAAVMLRSHVSGVSPERTAKNLYGVDHNLDPLITRATSSPATVANQTWAGITAHQAVGDLLQAIVSISAGAALLSRAQQISFDHRQSVRLPSRLIDPNYAEAGPPKARPFLFFNFRHRPVWC
jgi:hypothetical protein